jgi:hypothetical protein
MVNFHASFFFFFFGKGGGGGCPKQRVPKFLTQGCTLILLLPFLANSLILLCVITLWFQVFEHFPNQRTSKFGVYICVCVYVRVHVRFLTNFKKILGFPFKLKKNDGRF